METIVVVSRLGKIRQFQKVESVSIDFDKSIILIEGFENGAKCIYVDRIRDVKSIGGK